MDEERTTSGPDSPGTSPPAPKKTAKKAVKKAAKEAAGQASAEAAAEPAPTRSARSRKAAPAGTAARSAQPKKAEPVKAPAEKAQVKKAQPAKIAATKAPVKKAPATKAPVKKASATKAPAKKAQASKVEPAQGEAAKATPTKAPARKAAKSAARKTAVKQAPAVREPAPTEAVRGELAGREPAPTEAVREAAPVVPGIAEPRSVRQPSATLAVPPQRPELAAWLDAVTDLARHPDRPRSLERLAALAVARIGPNAAAWAGWLRDTYPTAPPLGIARLATRRATTTGRRLGVLAAAGPLGALLPFPATEWARATLVLRIAAAYGHDPDDPRRVPELLDLLELRTSGGTGALRHAANRAGWRLGRLAAARLLLGPTRAAGAVRALLATADQDEEMERLAHRAMLHYRGNPRPPRQRTPAGHREAAQGRFSGSRNSA